MATAGVCLLRGVNVGGRNKIKMDVLRALCEAQGLASVATYIQSGNVVFLSRDSNLAAVGPRLEQAIERECGFRPAVILRSAAELRSVVERNPFAERSDVEPAKLIVFFLERPLTAQEREAVLALPIRPEEVRVDGAELFVYFPDGMGKSKLPFAKLERAAGGLANTARNWNTVLKLLEMAEGLI